MKVWLAIGFLLLLLGGASARGFLMGFGVGGTVAGGANCILISGTTTNCLLISGTTTNALLVK